MLLLTLQLLTALPALDAPTQAPPSMRLLDEGLLLAQGQGRWYPPGPPADPLAGTISVREAWYAGLAVLGMDAMVAAVSLVGFFALAPSIAGPSGIVTLGLLFTVASLLDGALAPLAAAAAVVAVAGSNPTTGGIQGALGSGYVLQGIATLVALLTSWAPLLLSGSPMGPVVIATFITLASLIHFVGLPIAASYGLHAAPAVAPPPGRYAVASAEIAIPAAPEPWLVVSRF